MVVECGCLIRLSSLTSRSGCTKELGASSEDVMIYSEAPLVRLFADDDIEGLGEVVVKPGSGQYLAAQSSGDELRMHTSYALQVAGPLRRALLAGRLPSRCRAFGAGGRCIGVERGDR